ncbi:BtpA/SgcQ family protein [Halorussus salilacus]|uniref:BtpA/SgcQ family protein n=1 Tax=Halorussus salilacus TaxID=2953750 RepID=UPI0020A0AC59|nr:BtpA/SgcQ family protein [Halorussus salilacus]USZ69495.1 BtpA/SgcQ family protein [Halorussus salilacus]
MNLDAIDAEKPVVGMVHLPPLPGAPKYDGDFDAVHESALRDARRLEAGGVDALLVENFGDAPFYPDDVPKHVVASMTRVATEIRDAVSLPLGINVLRNDAAAALSVAAAVGAAFVRVNVHVGARVTDQGIVEGEAHETMRLRDRLDSDAAVLADLDVKHSAPLAERPVDAEAVAEPVQRGLAEGVLVSGAGTGHEVAGDHLEAVARARDEAGLDAPVLVGSGTTRENVADLLATADGVVVGTALKEGGETTNPVDEARVAELVAAADDAR